MLSTREREGRRDAIRVRLQVGRQPVARAAGLAVPLRRSVRRVRRPRAHGRRSGRRPLLFRARGREGRRRRRMGGCVAQGMLRLGVQGPARRPGRGAAPAPGALRAHRRQLRSGRMRRRPQRPDRGGSRRGSGRGPASCLLRRRLYCGSGAAQVPTSSPSARTRPFMASTRARIGASACSVSGSSRAKIWNDSGGGRFPAAGAGRSSRASRCRSSPGSRPGGRPDGRCWAGP